MPRFHVGQIVHLLADRLARSRDTCEVKRVLPSDGEPQYRIRSTRDPFERVALESEMEVVPPAEPTDRAPVRERTHRLPSRFRPRDVPEALSCSSGPASNAVCLVRAG
jgi:hypothetical protein